MPDIVVVFVWVVLDFVSHGLTADSMGVACFCVVACWFLACGMIFIGWWRGAWYIDECLLLMWLLCPALDLYVISEIVHLFRFVKGAGWWCGFLMFLSYVRPSFPSLKKLHRGHCHTYLSSSSWRFFMSSFFLDIVVSWRVCILDCVLSPFIHTYIQYEIHVIFIFTSQNRCDHLVTRLIVSFNSTTIAST